MKLTSILVLAMAAGTALGQNPDIIQNTKNTMNAVEQKKAIDSNAALAATQGQPAPHVTPASAPAKPAPAAKPATATAAKPLASVASKPAASTNSAPSSAKPVTASAKSNAAPAKPAASSAAASVKPATAITKPAATSSSKPVAVKPVMAAAPAKVVPQSAVHAPAAKVVKKAAPFTPQVIAAPKSAASGKPKPSPKTKAAAKPAPAEQKVEVEAQANPDASKDVPKAINLTGRRDPFISPVVNRAMVGSGCSTGKKCLAIDQISLKGVVRSDNGMIAVVVNAMNKAYFLRENDPVFNGYVVKITGDSIIFKETIQDKLGKPFTREVTKKITTSAV
jgi:hypothetical protein